MKPEIKYVTPYFAYNVKYAFRCAYDHENDYEDILDWQTEQTDLLLNNSEYFLLLRPLSALTKEIEVNGEKFVPTERLGMLILEDNLTHPKEVEKWILLMVEKNILELPYFIIQKLFEWHFDVFGLIKNGLAIDINTIK